MAIKRNIEWQFDFDTWLAWWGDDLKTRGRGRGKLCQARYNDIGPYHPDNCYKATWQQNMKESWDNNSERRRKAYQNVNDPKQIQTPHGVFPSLTAASKFYNINISSMHQRKRDHPDKYYYI